MVKAPLKIQQINPSRGFSTASLGFALKKIVLLIFAIILFAAFLLLFFKLYPEPNERFESTVLFGCCNPYGECTTCEDKNTLNLYNNDDDSTLVKVRLVRDVETICDFKQKLLNQANSLYFGYENKGLACQLKVLTTNEKATLDFSSAACLKYFCKNFENFKYEFNRVPP